MTTEEQQTRQPILTWLKGFGMGAADVVPGFSGGTVALLTGIYEELVTAISHFDKTLVGHLAKLDLRAAARHINFPFLAMLILGIGCGFISSMLTIHKLLKSPETSSYVFAVFAGLILGSSRFLWRAIQKIRAIGPGEIVLMLIGVGVAAGISSLTERLIDSPPLWFIFMCAVIAICAMILPGISGAMMLMIFGVYHYLLGIGDNVIHFRELPKSLTICVTFGLGCAVGLIGFSRFLKWLFATRPAGTMCVLFGLMLGSVVRLWPYQAINDVTPTTPAVWVILTVIISAVIIIAATEYADRKSSTTME
jgi:putative membrane protein